jgi:ABC-type lipoprotein export system ATPase subunit
MSVCEIRAEGIAAASEGPTNLRGVDLEARSGELLGITGPSGSGKTTLLHLLGGLLAPTTGRLLVDGRPRVLWKEASVGMIFQNLCLLPLLSAQETVSLPLQARRLPKAEIAATATATLTALGLGRHTAQLVDELSGGQRQRVAVARALAGSPDVILADEPTSALDPPWREAVLELLAAAARRGSLVVIASSDEEVIAACDRVITLR